jgi:hypothetical protein
MIFCKRGILYLTGYGSRRRLICVERERLKGTTSSRRIIATAAEDNNAARGCGPATANRSSVYPEQDSHSSDFIIRRGK